MALTGAYYDIPMGPIQHPGKERDTFIGLTTESKAIGEKLGIDFGCDLVEHHLAVMDSLDPHSTASLQKDLKAGHDSEIQGQLFDMIDPLRPTTSSPPASPAPMALNVPNVPKVLKSHNKNFHG